MYQLNSYNHGKEEDIVKGTAEESLWREKMFVKV